MRVLRPFALPATLSRTAFLLNMIPGVIFVYIAVLFVSRWLAENTNIPVAGYVIWTIVVFWLIIQVFTKISKRAIITYALLVVGIFLVAIIIRPEVNLLGDINIRQVYAYNCVAVVLLLIVGSKIKVVFIHGAVSAVPAAIAIWIGAQIATLIARTIGFNWAPPGESELFVGFSFCWASASIIVDALKEPPNWDTISDTIYSLGGISIISNKKMRIFVSKIFGLDEGEVFQLFPTVGGEIVQCERYFIKIKVGRRTEEISYYVDRDHGTVSYESLMRPSWVKAATAGAERLRDELGLDKHIRIHEAPEKLE